MLALVLLADVKTYLVGTLPRLDEGERTIDGATIELSTLVESASTGVLADDRS